MNTPTIEMNRDDALAKFRTYQNLAASRRTPEDVAAMHGYKALAAGHRVIDLFDAMHHAGLNDEGLPRLAIARADVRATDFTRDGTGGVFYPWQRWHRFNKNRGAETRITLPQGTWNADRLRSATNSCIAYVPTIPPEDRPKTDLKHFHILWEAVWEPKPPVDPMLLRHLCGTLYVVLAEWDLTPLEQAVLRGRITQERR